MNYLGRRCDLVGRAAQRVSKPGAPWTPPLRIRHAAVGQLEEGRGFEHVDGESDLRLDERLLTRGELGRLNTLNFVDLRKLHGVQILGLVDQRIASCKFTKIGPKPATKVRGEGAGLE